MMDVLHHNAPSCVCICLLLPVHYAVCRKWVGEPHGAEGQQLAWVSARQLQDYAMPAADIPLVPPVLQAMAGHVPVS